MYSVNKMLAVLGVSAVCALSANTVLADGGKFSYVEGRYIADFGEKDDTFGEGDGFAIGGSFQFEKNFYAFGSYDFADFDNHDAEVSILELGGGVIQPINKSWDTHAAIAMVRSEFEAKGYKDNKDTGFRIMAGARGMITTKIEARAMMVFQDIDDRDAYVNVGIDYFVVPKVSLGAEMDLGADYGNDMFSLGLRYHLK